MPKSLRQLFVYKFVYSDANELNVVTDLTQCEYK